MKLLFLDIDGVLNGRQKHEGSPYCGIEPANMRHLNAVLAATGAKIILTSAWRYQILGGATTLRGFEYMLYTHGLVPTERGSESDPRIVGHTVGDLALPDRVEQVREYLGWYEDDIAWACVDDLPLEFGRDGWRFVRTDGRRGLTGEEAEALVAILNADSR